MLEQPPYGRLMSPTMEKIWIAVADAFGESMEPFFKREFQVEPLTLEELEAFDAAEALALEELEDAILVAIEKGRDEALALQKKEQLEADMAKALALQKKKELLALLIKEDLEAEKTMASIPKHHIRVIDEIEAFARKHRIRVITSQIKEELEAEKTVATDMASGADERRGKKNEMAKRKRKKRSREADERRVKNNEMAERKRKKRSRGADERRVKNNEMAGRKRKKRSRGADERRVKNNEMAERKNKRKKLKLMLKQLLK